jgi:hypothetical protein
MDPEAALKTGNPGPEVELAFWKAKVCVDSVTLEDSDIFSDNHTSCVSLSQAENLNSLHQQLSGDKIRKVMKVLEVADAFAC